MSRKIINIWKIQNYKICRAVLVNNMSTYVVRLQNLPLQAQSYHVRNFFKGLIIPAGGVRIIGGPEGVAFILFTSKQDVQTAMGMNGGLLCNAHVKLSISCHSEMNKSLYPASNCQHYTVNISRSPMQNSSSKHNPEYLKYVECIFPKRQLVENDFINFFYPRTIELVKIYSGPDSTCESAIVKFEKLHDKNAALMKDGCYIRDCCVRILIPSEKYCEAIEMEVLKSFCDAPPKDNTPKDFCVQVLGISGAANYNSLGTFLGLPMFFKTKRLFIEMQEGMCKGRAYIDFETNHFEFDKVLKKHNSMFFSSPLQIRPVTMQQLVDVLQANIEFVNEENFIKQHSPPKPLNFSQVLSSQSSMPKFNDNKVSSNAQLSTSVKVQVVNTASTNDLSNDIKEKNKLVKQEAYQQTPELKRKRTDMEKIDESKTIKVEENKTKKETYLKTSEVSSKPLKECNVDFKTKNLSKHSEKLQEQKVEEPNKEVYYLLNSTETKTPNTDVTTSSKVTETEKLNPKKFCVRMANVSYQATEQAIQCFLKGIFIPASSIVFLKKGNVKLGHVFIRLYSAEEAQKAEQYHMKNFFGRTVTVKASYVYFLKNIWDKEVGQGFPDHIFNDSQVFVGKPTIATFHMDIARFNITCVHASNLPSDCNERDLYNILTRDHGICFKRAHIMRGNFGRCLGNCFIELNSELDCHRTVELHEKIRFFDRLLNFFPIKFQDMQMKIIMPPPHISPPQQLPSQNLNPAQIIPPPYPHAALCQPQVFPPFADFNKRARMQPAQFIPYPPKPLRSATIKLSELSSSVTQGDILNFFAEFRPLADSVKLVTSELDGQLTGEGTVAMETDELAKSAVDKLNGSKLHSTNVVLKLEYMAL